MRSIAEAVPEFTTEGTDATETKVSVKVLITGATGFLGSHLCRRMLAEGHSVRVLVRPNSDLSILRGLAVEPITGDVTDLRSLRPAVGDRDWVIHTAAIRRDDGCLQNKINVVGTHHVAEVCRQEGVKRLIHVSSVAAIGIPNDRRHPANESMRFNVEPAILPYHCAKKRSEEKIEEEIARGLKAVIVNPAFMFGPHGREYRGEELIAKVCRNRIVPYFHGGICVVHVHDVVDGILSAICRGAVGCRYILGGENLTYHSLVQTIARVLHVRRLFVPVPPLVTALTAGVLRPLGYLRNRKPRLTHADHYYLTHYHFYDSSKARSVLGYSPANFEAVVNSYLRFSFAAQK